MARSDEVFRPALQGKKLPIISLDNKWYKLMAGIDHTPHMQELEEQLKNLLKRQGKINTDLKAINKEKAKLRDEIVNAMDEEGGIALTLVQRIAFQISGTPLIYVREPETEEITEFDIEEDDFGEDDLEETAAEEAETAADTGKEKETDSAGVRSSAGG